MKKNILFLATSIFCAVFFSTCDAGLGSSVDLKGPTLTLLTPTNPREYFRNGFEVNGTCHDDSAVKTITVKIGSYEWKGEGGKWKYKDKGSEEYVDYADAKWELDGRTVNWAIEKINIDDESNVDVEVKSVDIYGNTSAESDKKLPIIIDNNPPVATVSSPYIKYGQEESVEFRNAYKDITDYTQGNILREILTGPFKIAANMREDTSVKYVKAYVKKVNVEDTGDVTDFIEKELVSYDQKDDEGVKAELSNPIVKPTLSSWNIEISSEDLNSLGNGKSYLQISTESCDVADNKDSGVQVHGYVLYWPDAGKPWITCDISESASSPKNVYAGSSLSATAQDDSKIVEVTTTVSEKKNGSFTVIPEYANQTQTGNSKRVNFEIAYPAEVGVYKIDIKAKDNDGNSTAVKTVYIEVMDKSFPVLEIGEITNPFGDNAGNFKINVRALDNTSVKEVKYKICESIADKTNFSNKDYSGWGTVTSVVTRENLTADSALDTSGGIERKVYPIEYNLNLFSDLGFEVGGKKLAQTTFIFRVEDSHGNKTIAKLVTPADTSEPEIAITKVAEKGANENILPIFTGDFTIEGTWSDDSFAAWKGNDSALSKGMPKISIKVRDTEIPLSNLTINTENSDGGTWIATVPFEYVIDSGSVVGAMDVVASITDIGGSTTTAQKGYQINTNVPSLDYVSCDKINGTYPTGTVIELQLNLTKAVSLTGSGTPTLTLNNNKTASYKGLSTNEKSLLFTYTVARGDDVEKLLVTKANLNGRSIKDKASDYVYSQEDLNVAIGNKALNKDIKILTSIPAYKSHSWNDTTKVLTIVFDGLVTAKSGIIEIVQNETNLLVPAYLTKDEYNNMPSTVQDYYEEGTLGASNGFVPNLETKYILKYETNTNNTKLKNLYIGTGAHKVSINIKSEQVSATQDENAKTTTFTIQVGALPCKGADYTFNIPAGLVKNEAGTTNAAKNTNAIKSLGIEEPAIRIKKPQQTITGCSTTSAGSVTHPLSTTFKIDCRTPGVTLNYKYDCLTPKVCTVTTAGGGENYEGANATSGLPSSWDINEKNKAVMLKKDGNTNIYYFTTWNISVDTFYYQILGCLVDEKTNTSTNMNDPNKNQGPSASIYMQNGGLVHHLPETPIGKGEYIVYDYTIGGSFFDIGIPGKVMNHR